MITTPRNWVGYAESHDEERNFYKAKTWGAGTIQTDSIIRISRVPLNIAFTTLLPGPKMIWEFGEMGYDYSIDSNGGRTNEKPSAWGWLDLPHRKAAYRASAKIINLRKLFPTAFTQGNFSLNVSASDWTEGRRIALTHNDLDMVVLGNFDAVNTINMNANFQKTGTWYNLLSGEQLNVTNSSMTFSMQPGDLLVFTDRKINLPIELRDSTVQKDIKVFPTITKGFVHITSPTAIKNVNIYTLQGLLVETITDSSEINTENFRSGVYLFEVQTLDSKIVRKIIKV
ncbi:MAG TPA: T9SS type A sorting domain-containing protein, partial [Paludibacter sp.]